MAMSHCDIQKSRKYAYPVAWSFLSSSVFSCLPLPSIHVFFRLLTASPVLSPFPLLRSGWWSQVAAGIDAPTSLSPMVVAAMRLDSEMQDLDQTAVVEPLSEKNFGVLRGGRYPFLYDNVYGLPIVRQIATYGEVLEGLRWV